MLNNDKLISDDNLSLTKYNAGIRKMQFKLFH